MTAIFNGKMKYLFLAPIALLVLFAIFNLSAVTKLNAEVLNDKKGSIVVEINQLVNLIDTSEKAGKEWNQADYRNILGSVITDMSSNSNNVFAALYDQDSNLISDNVSIDDFKNFDLTQLPKNIIDDKESDWIPAAYTNDGNEQIPMYVYYRWAPADASGNEYLIVVGVSAEDQTINQGGWLTISLVIELAATFLMNMAFVVLLCYLGAIYSSRRGLKWRRGD